MEPAPTIATRISARRAVGARGALGDFRAVVLLRLQHRGTAAGGALAAPLVLAPRPLRKSRMRLLALLAHLHLGGELRRQFEADAVGIEKVDRLEDVVVG